MNKLVLFLSIFVFGCSVASSVNDSGYGDPTGQTQPPSPSTIQLGHMHMESPIIQDNSPQGHIQEAEEWGIGDLHPLLVHFPIVLFFVAFTFDFLFLIGKVKEPGYNAAHWIVIIAAAMAIPTIITGFFAADEHPESPCIFYHRNWALITLAYSLMHATFRGYALKKRKNHPAFIFLFLSMINIGLISITTNYGGSVTHGKGLLIPQEDQEN